MSFHNLLKFNYACSANNIPNTYSAGLSIQALGRPFARVPRFAWTFLVFVAYTVAGVAGREHFAAILSNFLAILSYWTAFFVVIVAEEHLIFRRGLGLLGRMTRGDKWAEHEGGYNLDDWDSPGKLPLGVAGILAGCFGVAGAVVGMAEVTSPLLPNSVRLLTLASPVCSCALRYGTLVPSAQKRGPDSARTWGSRQVARRSSLTARFC